MMEGREEKDVGRMGKRNIMGKGERKEEGLGGGRVQDKKEVWGHEVMGGWIGTTLADGWIVSFEMDMWMVTSLRMVCNHSNKKCIILICTLYVYFCWCLSLRNKEVL